MDFTLRAFVGAAVHFRLLTLVDEYRRECLALDVARRIQSDDVLKILAWLFCYAPLPAEVTSGLGLILKLD